MFKKGGHMIQPTAIYLLRLILDLTHILCTKFELSSFSRSVDRRSYQIFNEGHVTRSTPPYGGILYFVS